MIVKESFKKIKPIEQIDPIPIIEEVLPRRPLINMQFKLLSQNDPKRESVSKCKFQKKFTINFSFNVYHYYSYLKQLSKCTCFNRLEAFSFSNFRDIVSYYRKPCSRIKQSIISLSNTKEHFDSQSKRILQRQKGLKYLYFECHQKIVFDNYIPCLPKIHEIKSLQTLTLKGVTISNLEENSMPKLEQFYFSLAGLQRLKHLHIEQSSKFVPESFSRILSRSISKLQQLETFVLMESKKKNIDLQYLFELITCASNHQNLKYVYMSLFMIPILLDRTSNEGKFAYKFINESSLSLFDTQIEYILSNDKIDKCYFEKSDCKIISTIQNQLLGKKKTSFKFYDHHFSAQILTDQDQIKTLKLRSFLNNLKTSDIEKILKFLNAFGVPESFDIDLRNNYLLTNSDLQKLISQQMSSNRTKIVKLELLKCMRLNDLFLKFFLIFMTGLEVLEELQITLKGCEDITFEPTCFVGLNYKKLTNFRLFELNVEDCNKIESENILQFKIFIENNSHCKRLSIRI